MNKYGINTQDLVRHFQKQGLIYRIPNQRELETQNDNYTGWVDADFSEEQLAEFFENPEQNVFNLLTNQYVVITNQTSGNKEIYKWDGTRNVLCKTPTVKSQFFGQVKPYNGDIYQKMALDSIMTNQVTMIKGKPGSGKSYLSIGCLMAMLEKHKIEKIIIFANPVSVGDACQLGFYPGSKDEKLLDSQVGNFLKSKLGGEFGVKKLMYDEKLILLPMADVRGVDTSGYDGPVAVYITEAQNFSISLLKLALQRIGEDTPVIIDGDYMTQVDRLQYAGSNNGMRRMSEVFRGYNFYGEVELPNIFRSEVARVADEM